MHAHAHAHTHTHTHTIIHTSRIKGRRKGVKIEEMDEESQLNINVFLRDKNCLNMPEE